MSYLLVLSISFIISLFLTKKIWEASKEIYFLLGLFLIYYWTLMGGWVFAIDNLTGTHGGDIGIHYYTYFDILFPVKLNTSYLYALIFYALFFIIMQATILFFIQKTNRPSIAKEKDTEVITLSNLKIIGLCVLCVFISYAFIHQQVLKAINTGKSLYIVTRGEPDKFFSLHQIFNEIAIGPLLIGFAVFLGGNDGIFIKTNSSEKKYFALYILAILFVILYLGLLGDKHELFFSGIVGLLFYLANVKKKRKIANILILFFIVSIPLFFIDIIRGLPILSSLLNKGTEHIASHPTSAPSILSGFFSNEMFAAHFSMYGVLEYRVPFTYGYSFFTLISSFIPRLILPERPMDAYTHYANSVGASNIEGYTIHHASAWYINFGLFGVILGAIILGYLWASCYRLAKNWTAHKSTFIRLFSIISPYLFVGFIPILIRSGIEGYKPLATEGFLLPVIILFLCCKKTTTKIR